MVWKIMFHNLNVMWTHWSEYAVVTDRGETEYPAPGPDALTYKCAQRPEPLAAEQSGEIIIT